MSQFTQEPSPPPEAPPEPDHLINEDIRAAVSPSPPPVETEPNYFTTEPNEFGLYRIYQRHPSTLPDAFLDSEDLTDAPVFDTVTKDSTPSVPTGPMDL